MSGRPLAVLDTNVLYPFQLRNFLLHLAEFGLFDPLWSEAHRCSLKQEPLDPKEYLRALARPGVLPHTASRLKGAGFLDLKRPVFR